MPNDPVSDMLTRIRNALQARRARVEMPSSKLKVEIARILKEEGYIGNFKVSEEGKKKTLRIVLRYTPDGESVISTLERVSRPGRRGFVGAGKIPKVLGDLGVNSLATPSGGNCGKSACNGGFGGAILCS